MAEAITWYVTLQAIALAVWPLVARAFAFLDDRGWALSKVAGLLLVAWIAWLLGMLAPVPFTRATLALVVLAVGCGSGFWSRRMANDAALIQWGRERRWLLLVWELVFLGAFSVFALLRAYDPAITGTEKPMDMAFLNGFVAAARLPTQDTWLAGFGVPYYYFGYFVFATLVKLSGVPAGLGYNLAAATVPALAALCIASLGWNVLRAACSDSKDAESGGRGIVLPGVAAGVSSLLVMFAGNFSAMLELLVSYRVLWPELGQVLGVKSFADGVVPGEWPPAGAWWWRASRVVLNIKPDGINEFPFFSAFLSDLHPHFMALPFEALVLGVAVSHVLTRGRTLRSPWTQGVGALALGSLIALNTWDIATFWLLYAGMSWLAGRCLPARQRLALVAVAPLGAIALFAPYFVGYGGPPLGLGIVTERTPLGSLLVLFGSQLALITVLGIWARWRMGDRRGWLLAGAGTVFGLGLAAIGEPTLGLLAALGALLFPWPGIPGRFSPPQTLALSLAGFSVAILLGVELIFLRDSFGTRMNTVFKFHYNVWLLAGLAGGLGVALVARERTAPRWLALAMAALALTAGLVYPASAIRTRLAIPPAGGPTLDGLAFLGPDEAAAIRWLRDQEGATRPVIAEAVGGEYSSAARMATYSGAAAVLGWAGHELQWRGPISELGHREADIAQLYRSAGAQGIRDVADRYGVQFVVVGDLERQQYGPGVETRFEGILPVAFRSGHVTIYRVPGIG